MLLQATDDDEEIPQLVATDPEHLYVTERIAELIPEDTLTDMEQVTTEPLLVDQVSSRGRQSG